MLSSRRQALRRLRPHGRSTPLFQYLTLLCAAGVLLGVGTGIAGAAVYLGATIGNSMNTASGCISSKGTSC